jgi:chemotaxis protein CheY-P-specific phosphatase CheC
MASDISTIVKEILSSTLETTISKKTDVTSTFNISKEHLQNKNIVAVDASFAYEQLTSNLKIIIPAPTASFIFNCMMMEDGPLANEISDDIADAVKEVVSQISGGMETAINGEAFEDLGATKFSIGEFAILQGNDYEVVNSLVLFKLHIEEQEFEIYIDFDEATVPYIEELKSSDTIEPEKQDEVTTADDELSELLEADDELTEIPEDTIDNDDELSELLSSDDDGLEEVSEETQEEISDELEAVEEQSEETANDTEEKSDTQDAIPEEQEDENISDDEELSDEEKKNKKLKLIIYIVAGLLASVIIGFIIAYFMGVFDPPPPPPKQEVNATKEAKKSMIIIDVKNKQIDYKNSMINEKRLNKRLALLTKYEILEEDVLAKFKQEEKERLHKLRMERLEDFAKNNKEESLFQKGMNKTASKTDRFANEDMNTSAMKKMQENEKLAFIEVTPLQYKKYNKIITREKSKSTSVSICKNDFGKISVYIGPMYVNFEVNNIIKTIKKKDKNSQKHIKLISLTQKEFDKMCDF